MTTKVFMLLGGLWGWDGYASSPGLWLDLASALRNIGPNVEVKVYTWTDWRRAVEDIQTAVGPQPASRGGKPIPKVVVIGYSGGGSRATYVANTLASSELHVDVDLLVVYDPSPADQMEPIGNNVRQAVAYENATPYFFGYGGGRLTGTAPITEVTIREWHMSVQFDQALHEQTVALVRRLQNERDLSGAAQCG